MAAIPQTPFERSLSPASFCGVFFAVIDDGGAGGRRAQVHEYPFRDTPFTEDLGRRARRLPITAFVIGDDATSQRDALIEVLERKGAGQLVHPSKGTLLMQVESYEYQQRWDKGRYVEFKIIFVEPGEILYPDAPADSQANVEKKAIEAGQAAIQDYTTHDVAGGFDVFALGASGTPGGTPAGDVIIGDITITPGGGTPEGDTMSGVVTPDVAGTAASDNAVRDGAVVDVLAIGP